MTVTADDRKRVVLPAAKPGDRFDLAAPEEGIFVLRRLEPVKARPPKVVKPILRHGVWVMPIKEGQLDQEALVRQIAEERELK
jgi:hypothetical protein